MIRKTLLVILVVFILVSIYRNPGGSATLVKQGVALLTTLVQRVFDFFGAVTT
jgi:hypothetical protein